MYLHPAEYLPHIYWSVKSFTNVFYGFARRRPNMCTVSFGGSPLRITLPAPRLPFTSVPKTVVLSRGSAKASLRAEISNKKQSHLIFSASLYNFNPVKLTFRDPHKRKGLVGSLLEIFIWIVSIFWPSGVQAPSSPRKMPTICSRGLTIQPTIISLIIILGCA